MNFAVRTPKSFWDCKLTVYLKSWRVTTPYLTVGYVKISQRQTHRLLCICTKSWSTVGASGRLSKVTEDSMYFNHLSAKTRYDIQILLKYCITVLILGPGETFSVLWKMNLGVESDNNSVWTSLLDRAADIRWIIGYCQANVPIMMSYASVQSEPNVWNPIAMDVHPWLLN